jgi:hypothetical protein
VEFLEQGIATIFQQMLQLKSDVKLPAEQAGIFKDLSTQLYTGTFTESLKVVNDRDDLLKQIRGQPGFENFLLPKQYKELCHAAQEGPIVILNSNKESCDGILIFHPSSEPTHISLQVTMMQLKHQQTVLKHLLRQCNRVRGEALSSRLFGRREHLSFINTQDSFSMLLAWLWEHIVSPVYQILESVSISKLCPYLGHC